MNHRKFIVAGCLGLAAIAAACTSTVGIGEARPFAFIDVRELPNSGPSGFGAYPSAIFIKDRVTGVVPSSALGESCQAPAAIPTDNGAATGGGSNLDPGAVSMTLKGPDDTTTRTVALTPTLSSDGFVRYTNGSNNKLLPGSDSLRFTVQGQAGGFPPFNVNTASVPHFVAQPVDDSIVGLGIRVQWTGLSANSPTRMQIALQYADENSAVPNFEVRCIAIDDGDYTIPRQYLTGWQDAGVDAAPRQRKALLSRFNTIGLNVADGVVAIVTRIDTTIVK
jgi:hypothetical protein